MRQFKRHDVRFKVLVDDGESYSVALVTNVSFDGMQFEASTPWPVGWLLRVDPLAWVAPSESAFFDLHARVVRCTPPFGDPRAGPLGGGEQIFQIATELMSPTVDTARAMDAMVARLAA